MDKEKFKDRLRKKNSNRSSSESSENSSSNYNDMIENDLELLWKIQDYCYRTPWLDDRMAKIINKHPWQDISSIIWFFFIIGLYEIGSKHFFVVMLNLGFSFCLRKLVAAKRPVEYDNRLQPLTDLGAESYGFPSLESYMSVVILGHMCISFKTILFVPIAIPVIFIVGFSRIYSRARFPHQIVGSWILGLLGLGIFDIISNRIGFHKMNQYEHGYIVGFFIVLLLANFGLAIEANESRLMGIPKKEFIRVMQDILNSSNSTTEDEKRNLKPEEIIKNTPRSMAVKKLNEIIDEQQSWKNGKKAANKKDSFYFLQSTLLKRQNEIDEAREMFQNKGFINPTSFQLKKQNIIDDVKPNRTPRNETKA